MHAKKTCKRILLVYLLLLTCAVIGCKATAEPGKIEPATHSEKTVEPEALRREITCEDFIHAWRAGNVLEAIQGDWFLHPRYMAYIHSDGSMTISVPWRPEFQAYVQGKIFQQGTYVYLESVVSPLQSGHLTIKSDVITCMELHVDSHPTELTIAFEEKSDSPSVGFWSMHRTFDHIRKDVCYEIDSKTHTVKHCPTPSY